MFKFIATTALMMGIAAPLAAKECDPVLMDYQFCPDEPWRRIEHKNAPQGLFLWRSDHVAGKLIVEMIAEGSTPEMEIVMDAIKDSVKQSLRDPSAVSFETADFIDGDKQDLGTLIYEIAMNGTPVRVHHSILISGNVMMQYITSPLSKAKLDGLDGDDVHREFVTSFKTVEPQHEI